MRSDRILLICVAAALVTITSASSIAHAGRRMLVLIDASGSMTTVRDNSDGKGANRFEAAKTLASGRVSEQASVDSTLTVAVYTFRNITTLIPATRVHGTSGFIDYNFALDEIEALNTTMDVGGSTPLAGAMCGAVDVLQSFPDDIKILQVSSDGEENSTPIGTTCQGDFYAGGAPYPATSWQQKVLNYFTNKPVVVQVDLFDSSQISLASRTQAAPDPEGILSAQSRLAASTPSPRTGLTPLQEFFTILTQSTGGRLAVVRDDAPLPVPGDLDGDRCITRSDAILVARAFGPVVPPSDGRYDLNMDRMVDFTDYQIQLSRITSTCGPVLYVPRAPLVCNSSKVVIDREAIEDGGLTIEARGSCEVVIRNSLIVSGRNAISIVGLAKITVDNSIIVGQNAVITQNGRGILSAANSVFHGATQVTGSFQYIDRGGNVFE